MSDYAKSVIRTGVQLLWGAIAVWLVHHSVHVSNNVSNWVVTSGVGVTIFAIISAIRWLETRPGSSQWSVWARALGRILMLGIQFSPKYPLPLPLPTPTPEPVPPAAS